MDASGPRRRDVDDGGELYATGWKSIVTWLTSRRSRSPNWCARIFLTGLPRSGTTYFQYLFDQDPDLRMLRTWEGERPVPPPASDSDSVGRRRAASFENARLTREATGGRIDAFHLTDVDGPKKCSAILDQTFVNPGLLWTMSARGYLEYLLSRAHFARCVRVPRSGARLLQWEAPPRRWALKWPCHLLALDAIHQVYPDARFVVTHRDPVQALASNCSLAHMLRSASSRGRPPSRTRSGHAGTRPSARRSVVGVRHCSVRGRGISHSCTSTTTSSSMPPKRSCQESSRPSGSNGRPASRSGFVPGGPKTRRESAERTSTPSTNTALTGNGADASPSTRQRFGVRSEHDGADR